MNYRKKAILEIKEKSLAALNDMIKCKNLTKLIEDARENVTRAAQEMNNEVDKLLRENEMLRNEN